jgi:hypothetical protein
MVLAISRSDISQRFGSRLEDDALRRAALERLQSSHYSALRQLGCEVTEAVIVLTGIVPTYYLKQMAQTIILRLEGIRSMVNLVEVRESDRRQPVGDEGTFSVKDL